MQHRLVAVVVVSNENGDASGDTVDATEARLELSRRSLRVDGTALVVSHVHDTRAAVEFIGGVGGVLDKRTLPQHEAKADAIYGAMASVPPAVAIGRLGMLEEHSALVLEHIFGACLLSNCALSWGIIAFSASIHSNCALSWSIRSSGTSNSDLGLNASPSLHISDIASAAQCAHNDRERWRCDLQRGRP